MAPNVTAHFFAANDINGAVLHEITDEDTFFRDLVLKLERDGLGSGNLTLSRMINFSGFASGTFQPEVFVRFIVHAYSDTVYYPWGFSQEKRQQVVVHKDEKGAEVFHFGGPGPKALLQRHALGIHSNLGGHWNLDLENGVWRWKETASIGRVLARILDEDAARADPSLPFLTYTFDQGDDSNGTPWADVDVAAEEDFFSIPIGTDFLTILRDMDDMVELSSWIDLGTVATPKYELNVIQGLGDDKTGSAVGAGVCLLKEGLNITNDALTVEGQNLRRASHVIVEGADGAWKVAERPGFVSGDYVKYVKIEFTRTKNEDWLDKVGTRWLHRQDRGEKEVTIELLPGVSDATGYYFPAPDRNLWLDNIISVDTSYDGSNHTELDIQPSEDNLVTGLELALGDAGETDTADATAKSWNVKAILNKERPGIQSKSPNQTSAANGGSCNCPKTGPASDFIPDAGDSVVKFYNANDPGGDAESWTGNLANQGGSGDGANGSDFYNFKSNAPNRRQTSWAAAAGSVYRISGYVNTGSSGQLTFSFHSSAAGTSNPTTASMTGPEYVISPPQPDSGNTWVLFSAGPFTAPVGTNSAALGRTAAVSWDELSIYLVGDPTDNDADAIDYNGYPHDSIHWLPSDYVEARLDELEANAVHIIDDLGDVDTVTIPPADGDVLTWVDADDQWEPLAPTGGGGGAVATDTIWDAKGDLAAGTGADTADNLTVGANDTILMADSAQTTGLKWVASATPSTQAFGDAAAVGTGDTFTRGDHKHAMPANPTVGLVGAIQVVINGNGSTITTGIKGDVEIPFNLTLTGWTLLADQSGAIQIDVWKDSYANFAPTDADSITNADEPKIVASGIKNQDATITNWVGEACTAGDILRFNVDSVTSITRVTLSLQYTRS